MSHPLLDYLAAHIQPYTQITPSWRTMLKDHRQHILSSADTISITPYDQKIYEYRLEDYLTHRGYPSSAAWIVLWINNLPSNLQFTKLSQLILPSIKYVTTLYQIHQSLEQQRTKKLK